MLSAVQAFDSVWSRLREAYRGDNVARRTETTVFFTDDIDGGKAEGTVTFGFDGASYEIDLSKKNRVALEKALAPYVQAARKVRTSRARRTGSSTPKAVGSGRSDLGEIRAWAKANGYEVSDRGRIPAAVLEAYDAR